MMPARPNTRMPAPDGVEPRELVPSPYQDSKWSLGQIYLDHDPPTEQRQRRPRAGWGNKFATKATPPSHRWVRPDFARLNRPR